MISGKLVESVDGGVGVVDGDAAGAFVGRVAAGTTIGMGGPNTVN